MTVSELITKLQRFDPNMRVMLNGYEGGYTDIANDAFYIRKMALNYHGERNGIYGEHELANGEYREKRSKNLTVIDALIISRDYELDD